ncbi:hypothetical protein [Paenibacillus ferrarius]|nr:hypothetical protein [Paenibacillus ferrarius]
MSKVSVTSGKPTSMTALTLASLMDTLLLLSTSGSLIVPSQLSGAVIWVP